MARVRVNVGGGEQLDLLPVAIRPDLRLVFFTALGYAGVGRLRNSPERHRNHRPLGSATSRDADSASHRPPRIKSIIPNDSVLRSTRHPVRQARESYEPTTQRRALGHLAGSPVWGTVPCAPVERSCRGVDCDVPAESAELAFEVGRPVRDFHEPVSRAVRDVAKDCA